MLGETLADNGGEGKPQRPGGPEEYAELFERWQFDPATMAAFQSKLGPEGTLRTLSAWADAPDQRPTASRRATSRRPSSPPCVRAWSPPTSRAASRRRSPVASPTVWSTPRPSIPDDYYGRGPYNPSGALNYLLYDQKFSDTFISTVADDLDQYERQDNDGASGLWGSRPEQDVRFSATTWTSGTDDTYPTTWTR